MPELGKLAYKFSFCFVFIFHLSCLEEKFNRPYQRQQSPQFTLQPQHDMGKNVGPNHVWGLTPTYQNMEPYRSGAIRVARSRSLASLSFYISQY